MIQNVLRHLGGIENYGIISLCLFCAVFAAVLIWALLQDRAHLEHISKLPLDTDPAHGNETDNGGRKSALTLLFFATLACSLSF